MLKYAVISAHYDYFDVTSVHMLVRAGQNYDTHGHLYDHGVSTSQTDRYLQICQNKHCPSGLNSHLWTLPIDQILGTWSVTTHNTEEALAMAKKKHTTKTTLLHSHGCMHTQPGFGWFPGGWWPGDLTTGYPCDLRTAAISSLGLKACLQWWMLEHTHTCSVVTIITIPV